MIIKELDASFGKLKNKKLVLKDGLNVICAPNESGKSTWCAFIRAMLYGIDTSRRKKEDCSRTRRPATRERVELLLARSAFAWAI